MACVAQVLEDYEETTKPPMQTTDDDMSQMDPNAFKEAATVMQEEFDSMLNRLEYRKKHRQTVQTHARAYTHYDYHLMALVVASSPTTTGSGLGANRPHQADH